MEWRLAPIPRTAYAVSSRVLGLGAGLIALVIGLIRYVTQAELRLELLAAGFTIIVLGLLMRPSRHR
jgi:hypothetical protein